jgi:hypothetical protein
MKHNLWIKQITLSFFVVLFGTQGMAKIISSEFLNQAMVGSEGPQLVALDLSGTKAFMLSYNLPGQEPLIRHLSEKEFLKLQTEMRKFLKRASGKKASKHCERELIYTKVENENKVSNEPICWADLGAKKRIQISDWFVGVRKTLQ